MPSFVINTNVDKTKVDVNILKEISSTIANVLKKPESFVCVQVNAGQMMTWGGSEEPCANCHLVSCGAVGGEVNKTITIALMEKINAKLKIPKDRMYISITDVPASYMGWNDMTIEDLIRSRAAAATVAEKK